MKFVGGWRNHPILQKQSNDGGQDSKESIYIHLINRKSNGVTCNSGNRLLQNQHYRYRDSFFKQSNEQSRKYNN